MKRVIIVHGWGSFPQQDWFPWLEGELKKRGFSVIVPAMPNPEEPVIKDWVRSLSEAAGLLDEGTYFVGHSIGCQAILRFLEGHVSERIGGVVFVAGWFELQSLDPGEDREIARPWEETPIDLPSVKNAIGSSVAIFSDNDPYVALEANRKRFADELGSKIVIEHGKGHMSGEDGVTELQSILDAVLEVSR
jgi:hypothetical protein